MLRVKGGRIHAAHTTNGLQLVSHEDSCLRPDFDPQSSPRIVEMPRLVRVRAESHCEEEHTEPSVEIQYNLSRTSHMG